MFTFTLPSEDIDKLQKIMDIADAILSGLTNPPPKEEYSEVFENLKEILKKLNEMDIHKWDEILSHALSAIEYFNSLTRLLNNNISTNSLEGNFQKLHWDNFNRIKTISLELSIKYADKINTLKKISFINCSSFPVTAKSILKKYLEDFHNNILAKIAAAIAEGTHTIFRNKWEERLKSLETSYKGSLNSVLAFKNKFENESDANEKARSFSHYSLYKLAYKKSLNQIDDMQEKILKQEKISIKEIYGPSGIFKTFDFEWKKFSWVWHLFLKCNRDISEGEKIIQFLKEKKPFTDDNLTPVIQCLFRNETLTSEIHTDIPLKLENILQKIIEVIHEFLLCKTDYDLICNYGNHETGSGGNRSISASFAADIIEKLNDYIKLFKQDNIKEGNSQYPIYKAYKTLNIPLEELENINRIITIYSHLKNLTQLRDQILTPYNVSSPTVNSINSGNATPRYTPSKSPRPSALFAHVPTAPSPRLTQSHINASPEVEETVIQYIFSYKTELDSITSLIDQLTFSDNALSLKTEFKKLLNEHSHILGETIPVSTPTPPPASTQPQKSSGIGFRLSLDMLKIT